MVTKAIIQSINRNTNKCAVRMPLFESASSSGPVVVEALINIPPGVYNNLAKDDVVFVAFGTLARITREAMEILEKIITKNVEKLFTT